MELAGLVHFCFNIVRQACDVQVGLQMLTPQWRGIVSAPASAWPGFRSLSSAIDPEFSELAGVLGGGGISH